MWKTRDNEHIVFFSCTSENRVIQLESGFLDLLKRAILAKNVYGGEVGVKDLYIFPISEAITCHYQQFLTFQQSSYIKKITLIFNTIWDRKHIMLELLN